MEFLKNNKPATTFKDLLATQKSYEHVTSVYRSLSDSRYYLLLSRDNELKSVTELSFWVKELSGFLKTCLKAVQK